MVRDIYDSRGQIVSRNRMMNENDRNQSEYTIFRQCPALSKCSLKIYYGGDWEDNVYAHKKCIWVDDFDIETASLSKLQDIASKLGHQNPQTNYSYRSHKTQDIVRITTQDDVRKMVEEMPLSRDLEVYFGGLREQEESEDNPTILFWNCRMLGKPAINMLKVLIKTYEPSIIFLIETRLSSDVIKTVASSLGFLNVWDSAVSSSTTDKDNCVGLAMLMKPNVQVNLIDKTNNYLDFEITKVSTGERWRLTGFYGHPKLKDLSWEWLRNLSKVKRVAKLPWIIFGDFNEILKLNEKSGGKKKASVKMKKFNTVKDQCGLHNMAFEGSIFTWERDGIKQRLDRGLITSNWKKLFPFRRVLHLSDGGISDHIPIVIQMDSGKHKENEFAIRKKMALVFKFAERLEKKYKYITLGLTTMSNIYKEIKPKLSDDFYFDRVKMMAPQIVHATYIAVLDTDTEKVRYERLVTLRTWYNLRFILWNCMVLPKFSRDDLEIPPECPNAFWKNTATKELNLSKHLTQTWRLVLMIPAGDKVPQKEIIKQKINEQVKDWIMGLTELLQNDNGKFKDYRDLENDAIKVGRAVILYTIIISVIRRRKMAYAGIISELERKLREDIKDYVEGNMNEHTIELYVTEPLKYLVNVLKWENDRYKIDTKAEKLSELEDKRFEAERKALMSKYLSAEIDRSGFDEIEKLKKLMRERVEKQIQEQIELLIDMNILQVNGNDIELVETNQSSESIVDRLEKAAATALNSIKNTTSEKPIKYSTYIAKIIKAYKK